MHIVGQEELDAIRAVLFSGKMFRYHEQGQCARFEERYAQYLGGKQVWMCASGTNALAAAVIGLGIGPGDEVIVPACTYMASAVAVLAAGAIPVIVDIDPSITLDPRAAEAAIGPHTRAIMPVHMWGLSCDMDAIMQVARRHNLLVIEDACQAVGGGYKGRMLGSIGHAGAFSFNYYKNMTCGEGGAVVSNDQRVMEKARCVIDCCGFYWRGRDGDTRPFTSNGARASEIEGAMMNAQLDRLPGMIEAMRNQKRRILHETEETGLKPIPANSLESECGSHVMFTLPSAQQADDFAQRVGGFVTLKTGRHVYTEWDPILNHQGAHHPAMNPFNFAENRDCRMNYSKEMCAKSLQILARTVAISTSPKFTEADVTGLVGKIREAAQAVL